MADLLRNGVKEHELPYWLVLNRYAKIGLWRIKKLIEQRSDLSEWFNGYAPSKDLLHWLNVNHIPLQTFDWAGVEHDLLWRQQSNCHIITWKDPFFPERLSQIPASPPVLFVKGQVELLSQPQIGMVGSRNPTLEGKTNAKQFAKQLASWGLIITSGLAQGIDGASHDGALSVNGPTIAALGNGLQGVYPPRHRDLADKITANGALVSELPTNAPPKREHFPRRNRIISGLSYGVIVVEAAQKSGSLITANYANEQGRDVFAIPGSIHNPLARGCHHLIRQGAMCVENAAQVLEALAPVLTEYRGDASINIDGAFSQSSNPTNIQEEIHSHRKDPIEAKLMAAVTDSCTPIDVILEQTGLSAQIATAKLLSLELAGMIKSVPGGVIRLTNR